MTVQLHHILNLMFTLKDLQIANIYVCINIFLKQTSILEIEKKYLNGSFEKLFQIGASNYLQELYHILNNSCK